MFRLERCARPPYACGVSSAVPRPAIRRPIATVVLIVLGLLTPIAASIAGVLTLFIDALTRTPRLRRTRGVALVAALIMIDLVGRMLVFGAWLIAPIGTNVRSVKSQRRYAWIMTWWTSALMGAITRIIPIPINYDELDESLLGGNAIVIGRHRSLLDAVFPAMLFGSRGLLPLYTLKEDLRWEPNMDIVGHRMGHVFITRSPKDLEAELAPIRDLGERIDNQSVGVIFPEGTFFNETRKARALKSIARRNPERLAQSETLDYLLPPRPAGTIAFLDGAPDADIIVLGHVGFEPFGTIREIFANMGAVHEIAVKAWRFPRSEIPSEHDEFISWLLDRWNELDDWIATHHPLPTAT